MVGKKSGKVSLRQYHRREHMLNSMVGSPAGGGP